jgi:hypothetical protein
MPDTAGFTKPELSRPARAPDLTVLLYAYELPEQQSSHCSSSGDEAGADRRAHEWLGLVRSRC